MVNFKLNVSDKTGKSISVDLKNNTNSLLGLKVGAQINASIIDQNGDLKITGGSDKSGIPMRVDVDGTAKKYVLLSGGIGLRDAKKGQRIRKLIRGNIISEEIYQVNCKFDGQLETPNENQ